MTLKIPTKEYDVCPNNCSDFDPVEREPIGTRTRLRIVPEVFSLDDFIDANMSDWSVHDIDAWILKGVDSGLIIRASNW